VFLLLLLGLLGFVISVLSSECYDSGKKTFLVQLGTPIPTELADWEA